MTNIPNTFPTSATDRGLHTFEEIGLGEMEIPLEMRFSRRLDPDRLKRAVELALDMHPVLGCRFVENEIRPYWERIPEESRRFFDIAKDETQFDNYRNTIMQTTAGPQLKACLWSAPDGDRLILKLDHHATDAGGVKQAAADIAALYTKLESDPSFTPEPRINAYRGELLFVRKIPFYAAPYIVYNFLREMIATMVPLASNTLKIPEGPKTPIKFIARHIPAERVAALSEYGRERNATLNDIVITAYIRAQAKASNYDGRSRLRLQTTVDMRRWYMKNSPPETVCNISSFEYPTLGVNPGADFSEALSRISSFMRKRKSRWPGMGKVFLLPILRKLTHAKLRKVFEVILRRGTATNNLPSALTNMGPIETGSLSFGGITPAYAWLLVPPIYPPLLGLGLSGYSGALTLSAGVPESAVPAIDNFIDRLLAELPR